MQSIWHPTIFYIIDVYKRQESLWSAVGHMAEGSTWMPWKKTGRSLQVYMSERFSYSDYNSYCLLYTSQSPWFSTRTCASSSLSAYLPKYASGYSAFLSCYASQSPIGYVTRSSPVSYTHLDVYKRQNFNIAENIIFVDSIVVLSIFLDSTGFIISK